MKKVKKQSKITKGQLQKIENFVIFQTESGKVNVEVFFQDNTLWLSQKKIAELFEKGRSTITEHLRNIFTSGELDEKQVCREFRHTTKHGAIKGKTQDKTVKYYNLRAVLSVGYRVNSQRAIEFRRWANEVLHEFVVKGFVLDDERLKQAKHFGKDYFDELLERVRSIRASERRIYQKITDIFAECSIDYDKDSKITHEFYATVQNKFHYAITGQTAAEIIYERADKNKPNMGLTTWENAPKGRILKSDTQIAKNYLEEKEIKKLERTVSSYFDYIENQIEIRKEQNRPFTMQELAESINKFLSFNDFKILEHKGRISHEEAIEKAEKEYDEFNKTQRIESDFDEFIKKITKKEKKK